MKLFSKFFITATTAFLMHSAYADDCDPCGAKEMQETPCPTESCAPTPCPPEPCAPTPCPPRPCPPKPCKPCPPVCFEPGYPTNPSCTPCAYNTAAMYELAPCPWDFWVDASFTYWDAYQEGLDLGVSTTFVGSTQQPLQSATYLFQDDEFKPGFKVGLGLTMDQDHWLGLLEYTWFRSKTTTGQEAPADVRGGTAVWLLSSWFSNQSNLTATRIDSSWRLNMDILDACLTRPYYQGTHLIIAPFGGIRGQWIRQKLDLAATIFGANDEAPDQNATSSNRSNSWGVGPRVGFQGEWHLGCGFRFEGDAAGSLLFTRYTKVSSFQGATTPAGDFISGRYSNYNTLRAGGELNLGIGWGTYFGCRNYHVDMLATYDFQVFWNQNMVRHLVDSMALTSSSDPNNLYLQGLTFRMQFDF